MESVQSSNDSPVTTRQSAAERTVPLKALRIALISLNYAPELTGIAPYSTRLAEALTRRGHQLRVLTGYPHYPEWRRHPGYRRFSHRESHNGVDLQRVDHYVPSRPGLAGRMIMEASFALRCLTAVLDRPDVVLAVSPSLLSAAAVVLRARLLHPSVPVVVWVQDLYGLGAAETRMLGAKAGRWLARFETSILRAASGVAVIHDRFADGLADRGHVPRHQITTIRNWTHVSNDLPAIPREEMRAELGWGNEEIIVLHAGNMGVKQDLNNVVAAAALAEGSRVRFVLMGDGNQRAALAERAQGLSSLTIMDPVSDDRFLSTLAAADVLLVNELATLSSMAVPSKLTSYFAAGVPVLAAVNAQGVTAEEVRASGAGIVVAPGRPHELVAGALDLVGDDARRRAMSAAGPEYRDRILSEHRAVDSFESWLCSMVQEKTA